MSTPTRLYKLFRSYTLAKLPLLVILLVLPGSVKSQILPKEGSVLNYRLAAFCFLPVKNVVNYTLEIATGICFSEDSFMKNIVKIVACKSNRIIAEVPSFGSQYTWRVVYVSGKSAKTKSELYHFTTGTIPEVDTNKTRFRVTKQATKFNDAFVFLDGNKVLYNMNGNPVWYVPEIEEKNIPVEDLKLTPSGTITFLAKGQAYEINYDGNVLWKAPDNGAVSGDKEEHYHHEFTRPENGHYMVLSSEFQSCLLLSKRDSCFRIIPDKTMTQKQDSNGKYMQRVPFGTIIEYDRQRNVAWSWTSSKYCEESDLINCDGTSGIDLHENAFFYDEKDNIIYVSFKQISRVIKIKYPEGTVIGEYGKKYGTSVPEKEDVLFRGQHSVRRSGERLCIPV